MFNGRKDYTLNVISLKCKIRKDYKLIVNVIVVSDVKKNVNFKRQKNSHVESSILFLYWH